MKKTIITLILIFSSGFIVPSPVSSLAESERGWEDETVYFLMVDRFYNGDESNDYEVDETDPLAYHGGDFAGIIEKLDDLKKLGFTALWLTPVFDNSAKGYHGYWIRDFSNTEEHFGNINEFKRLVDEAHKRDMRIILDFVVNHTSPQHPWVSDPTKRNWFHEKKEIIDWGDQEQLENGWIYGLPDLAQENPEVREYLIDTAKWWITETDIDGYRLDTVKHVPLEFWKDFSKEVKSVKEDFYLLGEVLDYDPTYIAQYAESGIDGFVDYPLYDRMRTAFSEPDQSLSRVMALLEYNDEVYVQPELMGKFLDNHDTPRFTREVLEKHGVPENRWKPALTFLYTTPGIPIVYYGTEIALDGGNDPDNRRNMNFSEENGLANYIAKLGEIRKNHRSLSRGDLEVLYENNGIVIFKRGYTDETTVIGINNTQQSVTVDIPAESLGSGELSGLIGEGILRETKGVYKVTIGPEESEVYLLREKTQTGWIDQISLPVIFVLLVVVLFFLFGKRKGTE